MGELRMTPRWEIQKTIGVQVEDDQECRECFLEDMSFKGMRISFKQPLPMKRFIPMRLLFESGPGFVNILSDVRWGSRQEEKHIYGIYFQRIDASHQAQLQQFLNHCFSERWHHRWQESEANVRSEQKQ